MADLFMVYGHMVACIADLTAAGVAVLTLCSDLYSDTVGELGLSGLLFFVLLYSESLTS